MVSGSSKEEVVIKKLSLSSFFIQKLNKYERDHDIENDHVYYAKSEIGSMIVLVGTGEVRLKYALQHCRKAEKIP